MEEAGNFLIENVFHDSLLFPRHADRGKQYGNDRNCVPNYGQEPLDNATEKRRPDHGRKGIRTWFGNFKQAGS